MLTPYMTKVLYSTTGNTSSQSLQVVCMCQQNTGKRTFFKVF